MINMVILIGRVGKDPEVRYTQGSGTPVANFSLATDEYQGEGKQPRTEWHNIVVWGRQAEIAGQYVKKGRQLYVEGRNQTRDYEKDGVKHYRTEVVARRFQMLGGRNDADHGSGGDNRATADSHSSTGRGETVDDYDIGDLGPPLDMDDAPGGGW